MIGEGIQPHDLLAQAGKFTVFQAESIALSVGDTVRITKNFRSGGARFRNNELHTVTAIDAGKLALDETAPVTFLDPTGAAAVNKDSKFRVSLYKALLFLHVQSAIK